MPTTIGDISLCLTTGGIRESQAKKEFAEKCLDVQFFRAIPGATSFESFNMSQYAMIARAVHEDAQTASMFEDDVIFKNSNHLWAALFELPIDWDIVYLGANITGAKNIEILSQHLARVSHAWTTHAVIYSRKCMDKILKLYNPASGQMYDDWLARNIVPLKNTYCVNPMICWQRPGNSELWGRETDYSPCFEQGDRMMAEKNRK